MTKMAKHNETVGILDNAHDKFRAFAQETSRATGHPAAFVLAVTVVIVWAVTGPLFGFSDTWQLVINTGTTIVTFLMVFLIQNTQNRDSLSLQLKLSELVLSQKGARNRFAELETFSDAELEDVHKELCKRAEHTLKALHHRRRHKSAKTRGRARKK